MIVIEGAVGTAKTSIGCIYIAAHCAENNGAKWLVIRRTIQSLKDNTINGTWLRWFGGAGTLVGDRDQDFHLDCEFFGKRAVGTVMFRPAQEPDDIHRFMGGEYAGVLMDEAAGNDKEAGLPEDIYTGLESRLRQPGINWACANCRKVLPKHLIPSDMDEDRADCPFCGEKRGARPRYHMLLALNPAQPGSWLCDEFPLPAQQTDDVAHFQIPLEDNKANLPRGYYKRLFERWKIKDDWVARFLRGERVPLGKSTCVFNRDPLLKALGDDKWVEEPLMRGVLESGIHGARVRFSPSKEGPLRVWQAPHKNEEDKYIIGADAGEGLQHRDPSCGMVLSRATGDVVAEWHAHVTPRQFAEQLALLGWWYNTALIVPEVEPSAPGRTTCDALEGLKYFNLYQQRREQKIGDPPIRQFGLPMHKYSKARIVTLGREVVEDHKFRIPNRELIIELLGFVEKPSGRMAADEGQSDDRVMAWLCALEGYHRIGTWTRPAKVGQAPKWMTDLITATGPSGSGDRSWMGL